MRDPFEIIIVAAIAIAWSFLCFSVGVKHAEDTAIESGVAERYFDECGKKQIRYLTSTIEDSGISG